MRSQRSAPHPYYCVGRNHHLCARRFMQQIRIRAFLLLARRSFCPRVRFCRIRLVVACPDVCCAAHRRRADERGVRRSIVVFRQRLRRGVHYEAAHRSAGLWSRRQADQSRQLFAPVARHACGVSVHRDQGRCARRRGLYERSLRVRPSDLLAVFQ